MRKGNELYSSLGQNKEKIYELCDSSDDIVITPLASAGIDCIGIWCDGMVNMTLCIEQFYKRVMSVSRCEVRNANELIDRLSERKPLVVDCKRIETFEEVIYAVMSGAAVLIANGCTSAVAFAAPGFSFRAVSESYTEENVRSSREGFVEPLKVNMTLVRRRIKSEKLVFKTIQVGEISKTEVAIVYLSDRVNKEMVSLIEKRLQSINLELVLESGFIEPFFENSRSSLFSGTGHTERPDTLCGKLREGRVGIIVDGTPFAIIIPFLFIENFQSFDDYTNKPYYSSFIRVIKYLAFFISIYFPGLYVALANFNPELIPAKLLYSISISQKSTPLPLMFEAIFITVVYEIVREAGLRLPRPVGHAVSLIGALVVGEAAVNAGLIGSPMVMVVALTAISAFTIPMLHEPITILRFSFILVGGLIGPVGLALGFFLLILSICSINSYGVPYAAMLSPFSRTLFVDGVIRMGWEQMENDRKRLWDLNGAELKEAEDAGYLKNQ